MEQGKNTKKSFKDNILLSKTMAIMAIETHRSMKKTEEGKLLE